MKLALAMLVLSLVINDSLCQRGGRRGNRPLRQRQRQGRILAAQNPLGPPPQPAILLSSADPILITNDGPQALPREGRQQFRQGRQFDTGAASGSIPDEEGNYNFEFTDDDGSVRRENGISGGSKDGEVQWTSPEGDLVTFSYVADENGYQASGSHDPVPVPLPNGDPNGPGGARNNLEIWADLMQIGR